MEPNEPHAAPLQHRRKEKANTKKTPRRKCETDVQLKTGDIKRERGYKETGLAWPVQLSS